MASNALHRREQAPEHTHFWKKSCPSSRFGPTRRVVSRAGCTKKAELAPGTEETYSALTDPRRRPPRPREHISDHFLNMSPALFELDEDRFAKNLRSARKGAAPGPSGMVVEHLRPLLENPRNIKLVVLAGEVGGRWSEETATFLRLLAVARARSESALCRIAVEAALQCWSRTSNLCSLTCCQSSATLVLAGVEFSVV